MSRSSAFCRRLIAGEEKACFAVTEPDVGLDTTQLKTRAVRHGNGYVVHGPQDLDLDRAGRREDADPGPHHAVRGGQKRTDGLTLFYTDLDRSDIEVRDIPKMGRKAVDSNLLFIDGLNVPAGGPHRRGGQGLPIHPARHEPGAHPDRRRGDRPRPRRAGPRRALCQGARRVRPADRPEPGDPAPARRVLDRARGRQPDDAARRPRSTTRASPAASRPTPPNISPPRPASPPARPPC